MRLASAHIVNFRCLRNLEISFEDVTALVGANSTGKSSVLHALDWFFGGGALSTEEVHGHQSGEQVSVGVSFTSFDDADRAALGPYVLGDEASFWRTWSEEHGEKLTGRGRAFPPFAAVRSHERAMEKRTAYNELREAEPGLELPKATSAAAVDRALAEWENAHSEMLEEGRTDATHLFGFAGQARLAQRMDFVLIPAVSDPEAETRDARGTLLRQLLDRALGDQSQLQDRLLALQERTTTEIAEIMSAEGGAALDQLSQAVTTQLAELVPGGEVLLSARPTDLRMPSLAVELRIADGGFHTAVGRQGHGFQRALLIAVVEQLAAFAAADDPAESGEANDQHGSGSPALVLAIEEPELYQHPLQARHFALTLASLGEQADTSVQVTYATHSEYFVDPAHYERLRRFRRRPGVAWPDSEVTHATIGRVVDRLKDIYKPDQIPMRVQMTLRRQVAQAVFAKAVVLVEGESDVGLVQGLGDRIGGLDSIGVAVVGCHGKKQLLIPWAILTELGVPCFVVFDADAGAGARMRASGKNENDIESAESDMRRTNALVLQTLGLTPVDWPETAVSSGCAVFADRLETELDVWSGFQAAVSKFKDDHGDFRGKPDDAYRHAALNVESQPPAVLLEIISHLQTLAG